MLSKDTLNNKADEIWKSAIKLRGKFKAYEYQNVILPIIMLRRIECDLEDRRESSRAMLLPSYPEYQIEESDAVEVKKQKSESFDKLLKELELDEYPYFNKTSWTILNVINDNPSRIEKNFREYINGFSPNVEEIFDKFEFATTIGVMDKNDTLEPILRQYSTEMLGPKNFTNLEMGYVYEELLRKFSEQSGEEAGEHFTPREVIRLMVELLNISLNPSDPHKAISIYDPACGTGGMLSVSKEYLLNKCQSDNQKDLVQTVVQLFGQEKQPKNYAICKADMLIKGEDTSRITQGNSLVPDEDKYKERGDLHAGSKFDFMLSNPPFGVNWSDYAERVKKLSYTRYYGNFPTVKDGALLFLMSMIEKMKSPEEGGSHIAIIFNGSPLSNGDALSGESEIRKFILEKDLLDTIIMLPDQLFYNTGIFTYIWILSNVKPAARREKVAIINARDQFSDEPKSMGQKRHRLDENHRKWIVDSFNQRNEDSRCKIFHYRDFAFHKVQVVFWQTDENDQPAFITEKFSTKLNEKNVSDKVVFFGGDAEFFFTITDNFNLAPVEVKFNFKLVAGDKFEKTLARHLKEHFKDQLALIKPADIFKWWQRNLEKDTLCEYTHRHYITDFEYIPWGEDISQFIHREIDKPVIFIENDPPVGYEILPNKYFFTYTPPPPAHEVIAEFWQLEAQAAEILKQLEGNGNG